MLFSHTLHYNCLHLRIREWTATIIIMCRTRQGRLSKNIGTYSQPTDYDDHHHRHYNIKGRDAKRDISTAKLWVKWIVLKVKELESERETIKAIIVVEDNWQQQQIFWMNNKKTILLIKFIIITSWFTTIKQKQSLKCNLSYK